MKKTFCDSCEKEIINNHEVFVFEHIFGYGSHRDGDLINIDICEDCFDKLDRNIKKVKDFE